MNPLVLVLEFGLALHFVVVSLAELRMRTVLEPDAVVVVHALRRTRIPWTDVHDVQVRYTRSGRALVELVRANSRKVVLPAPVTIYPVLKQRMARVTAATTR